MSRAYRTREQWRELIAEFEQSCLSQKDFCEPYGINPGYFSKRRIEVQHEVECSDSGFALAVQQSAIGIILTYVKHASRSYSQPLSD